MTRCMQHKDFMTDPVGVLHNERDRMIDEMNVEPEKLNDSFKWVERIVAVVGEKGVAS